MSSCVSSQPSSNRAAPHDELGGGGGSSSEGRKPCEALRGLSSLSIRLGMESFVVVTECEPACPVDLSLTRDRPLEADGGEVPLDASVAQARPLLSSRKLSLQERTQLDANGRGVCPALPHSPVGSPQSSPRLPRRPTVESHHVSITGMQVRERRPPVPCPCACQKCLGVRLGSLRILVQTVALGGDPRKPRKKSVKVHDGAGGQLWCHLWGALQETV